MPIKILMPALSPTMTEGNITKWFVKVGDQIKAGDVLAEIETDKATMEVEAVDEGKITSILIKEGTEGVAVNSPIAILDNETIDSDVLNNKKDYAIAYFIASNCLYYLNKKEKAEIYRTKAQEIYSSDKYWMNYMKQFNLDPFKPLINPLT